MGEHGIPIPNLADLVRTRLVVGYLDGVDYMSAAILDTAREIGVVCAREQKGELEGYFAHHLTFEEMLPFRFGGATYLTKVTCEVQVATWSATRVWDLSHKLYESDRDSEPSAPTWQWDQENPRFLCHQLGHVLHLTEGLFVQLRNKLNTKGAGDGKE